MRGFGKSELWVEKNLQKMLIKVGDTVLFRGELDPQAASAESKQTALRSNGKPCRVQSGFGCSSRQIKTPDCNRNVLGVKGMKIKIRKRKVFISDDDVSFLVS